MRVTIFDNYNTISILPGINLVYERNPYTKKMYYFYIDIIWLHRGVSISLIQEQYKP